MIIFKVSITSITSINIIKQFIIYYFESFFESALTNGLSLKFQWQEVFSNIQDSSQYSGLSQWYSSLNSLHSCRLFPSPPILVLILLVTVPIALITIGINITFMFYSFCNSQARNLSFFSLFFNFTLGSAITAKSTILQVLFFSFFLFLLIIVRSGRLAVIT